MSHKQKRVNALRLKQLLDSGVTKEDLAKACGVHKNAVVAWLRLDDAPYWTEYVCEALEKRHSEKRIIICEVQQGTATMIATLVELIGGSFHILGK